MPSDSQHLGDSATNWETTSAIPTDLTWEDSQLFGNQGPRYDGKLDQIEPVHPLS